MDLKTNNFLLRKKKQLRQPRGRSIDSPDDSEDNRLIVSFSQHHNQGIESEDDMHAGGQYKNVHQIHQVCSAQN